MIKKLVFIAAIYCIGLLGDLVSEKSYLALVSSCQDNGVLWSGVGFLLAVGLLVFSLTFVTTQYYQWVYTLSKLIYEAGQFLICLLSFLSVAFFLHLQHDFWIDLGPMLGVLPFVLFFSACLSIRIFDFNYPVRNTTVALMSLAVLSRLVIWVGQLFGL